MLSGSSLTGKILLQVMVAFQIIGWGMLPLIASGQEILPPKQPIESLGKAQTIYLQAKFSKRGIPIDPQLTTKLIIQRFQKVGYKTVLNREAPHDVTVIFQCIEPTRFNTIDSHKEGIPPISVPPCLFHYAFQETPIRWQRIDIIIYNEGIQATESLRHTTESSPLSNPLPIITQYLRMLDFPILLSAEWGQVLRLLDLLENTQTTLQRRKKIISLLGEIQAKPALPYLINLLTNPAIQLVATQALGNFGTPMQQPLLAILKTHPDTHMQAAAAQSLGRIGAASGDTSLTPHYIALLEKADLNILVKTEVVWAIGKSPDFRAHPILETLENEVWKIRSDKPDLQKLREALDWSLREVRQGGHTGDYS